MKKGKSFFKHFKYGKWKITVLKGFPIFAASKVFRIKEEEYPFESVSDSCKRLAKERYGKDCMIITDYPNMEFQKSLKVKPKNKLFGFEVYIRGEELFKKPSSDILDKIDEIVYENVKIN